MLGNCNVPDFRSVDEMIEWGRYSLGKYDSLLCNIGEQKYLLCGTDLAYEDAIWDIACNSIQSVLETFDLPKFDEIKDFDYAGVVPELRDFLIDKITEIEEIEIVLCFDEY